MADAFEQLMSFVLSALGLVTIPDTALLGLAIAIVAALAVVLLSWTGFTAVGKDSPPHPLRAIDASTLLSQSDPDAAGHPRPRAPGAVRAV
ncbi:DUF6412 domain-containing protein [Microbacterium sp. CIAB417]|uniref:DUF6412 domain-containing protein n=1 Tax=Microbacterium sp. CIAB417 TaxID=2860287 RepID=UPI001FADE66A|nr:DUF6412 domain-containing protein [Microbacterium sp. CIAB417]